MSSIIPDGTGTGEESVMDDVLFYTWLLKNGASLLRQLDIRKWFRSEDGGDARPILLIGPGGVGKSTLGMLLSAEYDPSKHSIGEYDESIQVERLKLDGDLSIEIVIPPGQEQRRDAHWTDLETDLVAGRFRGVILVASYGYHSIGDFSYESHRLYSGDKAQFLAAYLEQCRRDENSVISRLAPLLKVAKGRMWLLTLVTKQDLWWDQRIEVERYYRESAFGAMIAEIVAAKDSTQFLPETVHASLVIGNFKTGAGEVLQLNTAGYDSALQEKSFERLRDAIYALKEWEDKK